MSESLPDFKLPPQETVNAALQYVEQHRPTWVLEPTSVKTPVITDEQNKKRLEEIEVTATPTETLSLYENLSRLLSVSEGQVSDAPLCVDMATASDADESVTLPVYVEEELHNPLVENKALEHLKYVTAAGVLREDPLNDRAVRIYAGTFLGIDVYFSETLTPRFQDKEIQSWERRLSALSLDAARRALSIPSPEDLNMLSGIGALRGFHNEGQGITRQEIPGVVNACASLVLSNEG